MIAKLRCLYHPRHMHSTVISASPENKEKRARLWPQAVSMHCATYCQVEILKSERAVQKRANTCLTEPLIPR